MVPTHRQYAGPGPDLSSWQPIPAGSACTLAADQQWPRMLFSRALDSADTCLSLAAARPGGHALCMDSLGPPTPPRYCGSDTRPRPRPASCCAVVDFLDVGEPPCLALQLCGPCVALLDDGPSSMSKRNGQPTRSRSPGLSAAGLRGAHEWDRGARLELGRMAAAGQTLLGRAGAGRSLLVDLAVPHARRHGQGLRFFVLRCSPRFFRRTVDILCPGQTRPTDPCFAWHTTCSCFRG